MCRHSTALGHSPPLSDETRFGWIVKFSLISLKDIKFLATFLQVLFSNSLKENLLLIVKTP